MDGFATADGLYRTYNITLDGNGENSNISTYQLFLLVPSLCIYHILAQEVNPKIVYPGDNVTSFWSSSSGDLANTTWTNRIFVIPGVYGVGNGSTSYEFARTVPADDFTRAGLHLSLNGPLWSFGDVVWKNTEIWVTGEKNHDWCDK